MNKTQSTDTALDYREVRVTPTQAKAWLELNISNRKKKPGKIHSFAEDMRNGMWSLNGEALKFTGTYEDPKKLIDGQNRLYGVIKAGVPVTMSAIFQIPESAQESMDSGTKRTVADNLTIGGAHHANILASAASIAIRVQEGNVNGGQIKATNVAVQRFIRDNPDLAAAAEVASRYSKRAEVAPSFLAYSFWVMARIDPDEALDFWKSAAEKVGLGAGDPVIAMTNRFADLRRQNKKLYLGTALSIIFRAWNYRRQGKPLSVMKVATDGKPIAIPAPI